MRRTIMRYVNLTLILALRVTCLPVKKRFPLYDDLVEAGLLEKGEKEVKLHFTLVFMFYEFMTSEFERNDKTSILYF